MDRPHYHPCYSDCPDGLLAGALERHTPGAGWARAKAELGDMVPDLTEEDERAADALLANLPARRHHVTTPDPEPRRVEPTGNPRVDALIAAMVCPSCRTIYNAAKAKCADLWHRDNQPAVERCNARYPSTDPTARIVHCGLPAGHDWNHVETDTEYSWPHYATGGVVETGPVLVGDGGGCVMPTAEFRERLRVAMATQRVTVLPPSESERERAAYERGQDDAAEQLNERSLKAVKAAFRDGVAEGRRQATEGWERQWAVIGPVGPYSSPEPGVCGRCGGTGMVHGPGANGNWTDQACDCEEDFVALCDDEDQAHEVLDRWKAPNHRIVSRLVGPWEPAEQDGAVL